MAEKEINEPRQIKEGSLSTLKLREELLAKEKEYYGKPDILGATFLTNPAYASSSRSIMFTSQLRQSKTLNNPDFPAVFTNNEDIVGKFSTGYYRAKRHFEVVDRIFRFDPERYGNHSYTLFMYDPDNDRYEVIEKKNVEDLTEKFGFSYNNDVMDAKEIGDEITKGEVLYRSTSYDEDMHYRFGKNVPFLFVIDPNTIEDAIVIAESLRDEMMSKEIERVKVSLNDNDILCNIYGDNDSYKVFPNIGEMVKDKIVCAKRRIHNSQVLFDLKKSNLRKINYSSDTLFFCGGRVVDINIYCNKTLEELTRNNFNAQIIEYLEMQEKYYRSVYLRCKAIRESGSKYSDDINYLFKRAKNYLDENFKWREEDDSVFSNISIEFIIERDIDLNIGQKITGRYGNKGIVARIVPDDQMPVLETGKRVKALFNALSPTNRLISQVLFEQSMTFIANRTSERLCGMTDQKEQIELVLNILGYLAPEQSKSLRAWIYHEDRTPRQKAAFVEYCKKRIPVENPPMWETEPMFDRLMKLYNEHTWIKPYRVYTKRFGRVIQIMKPLVCGEMYVMKMKQTSKKGFSARSTGGLSKRGLPEKTNKAKTHQEMYSKTPIKIGDQENINLAIGANSDVIARLHLFYRSSVIGRRDLESRLMTSLKQLEGFKYSDEFTNRNIEILNAYFLFLGLRLEFESERYKVVIYDDVIRNYEYDNKTFIMTLEEFEDMKAEMAVRKEFRDNTVLAGPADEVLRRVNAAISDAQHIGKKRLVIDAGGLEEW